MMLIKNSMKGTTLYCYHITHPENEFIQTLMEKSFILDNDTGEPKKKQEMKYATHLCYLSIVKDHPSIIDDIILDMNYMDLEMLGKIAIDVNNRDIIELLHKNGLTYDYYILHNLSYIWILQYTYEKHGSELIKFMIDSGIDCQLHCLAAWIADDIDLLSYIKENMEFNKELFMALLRRSNNSLLILNLFEDKADTSNGDEIFCQLANKSPDTIKSFLEYGIVISSNAPLVSACEEENTELIKFYLQYGLKIDKNILDAVMKPHIDTYRNYKNTLGLFLEYDVDFSILKYDNIDYNFLADLENHGLDKDGLLSHVLFNKKN